MKGQPLKPLYITNERLKGLSETKTDTDSHSFSIKNPEPNWMDLFKKETNSYTKEEATKAYSDEKNESFGGAKSKNKTNKKNKPNKKKHNTKKSY